MRLNADLNEPVIVHAAKLNWVPSPAAGVDRRMLYREGAEVARATSIVRYAPNSAFPEHVHSGGEEILVLDGTFQDEHGDYPAGSYFRNPPGTAHSPAAAEGCTIFVRLWQYRSGDDVQVNCQPGEGTALSPRPGAKAARLLFEDAAERVWIEEWSPGTSLTIENQQGLEFLVTDGNALINGENCVAQSWGRLPAGQVLEATVGQAGAQVWLKAAPLQHADILKMPG
ncbi:cupin domain-containing protein [Paracoccus zhejiangensis]|uniref:Cupin n=1 Tax=Paracoccus zhejiangensis TaxID=1077935 RepID=A0A2H5F161_9RHOB|nr:cupin domain-containing protein [Paracoccus zhejiangensis]AUH65285.1 cupin [Paracoccus zhejiangensis]